MRNERSPTIHLLAALGLMAVARADEAGVSPPAVPGSYFQEVSRQITTVPGVDRLEVYSLALDEHGWLLAGTSGGLLVEGKGGFALDRASPRGVVECVAARAGEIFFTHAGALHRLAAGRVESLAPLPWTPVALIAPRNGSAPLIAGPSGLFVLGEGRFEPVNSLQVLLGDRREVRAVAESAAGEIAVAAEAGLFVERDGAWRGLDPRDDRHKWRSENTRAVAFDAGGRLWIGGSGGAAYEIQRGGSWRLLGGAEGLPRENVTCVSGARDGSVWLGTRHGMIRYHGGAWEYRQGRRWLPGDEVTAVVARDNGGVAAATPGGIGIVARIRYTLAEKARHFEEEIDHRHRRTPYGFVNEVYLERSEDLSVWRQSDSDNDGLWTSMYGAGECFAYAVTKDPQAKSRARRAFWALRFLGAVTQGGEHPAPPGFPARTVLPADGPDPNAGRLERDREEKAHRDSLWKVIDPRWPRSADGKWYWKCDTSSDELDGHYFFYALYHDLVAESESEKDEVRRVVAAMTDHLITHGFRLVDHDGQPTRWGRFAPSDLNHDPLWWRERGLNSLSMLSYLKVAEHVTGDAKYAAAARDLIENHGYAMNLLYPKVQAGPGTGNQSDDEMAFMSFYNLVRLEKDPALRSLYTGAFRRYWILEKAERNPFFDFLYAAASTGKHATDAWGTRDLSPPAGWHEDPLDSLHRFPLDLQDWKLENSHRLDVVPLDDLTGEGRSSGRGRMRDGRALPIDERYVNHWNHDPWDLDQGGGGRELSDGASFLLAYYLGLHHGFVAYDGPPRAGEATQRKTGALGVSGTRFTVDGTPTFLAGVSYYGGLAASVESIVRDLDDLQPLGFNWIRVWATWQGFGAEASAVNPNGDALPVQLERLRWLVSECSGRGIVVDVTLSRGNGVAGAEPLATLPTHLAAVKNLVEALRDLPNWYLDLSNERNIGDARFTSFEDLRALREAVRRLDPPRLVTASHGGDISAEDARKYLLEAGVDFLTPHRPRHEKTAAETLETTRRLLAEAQKLGRSVPVHYQEPFRRGYDRGWEPSSDDFVADLRGALEGGAAGWCFHNGSQRSGPESRPRRSFDLRSARLLDQLDTEERRALEAIGEVLQAYPTPAK